MSLIDTVKNKLKEVKIDQEGLTLLKLDLRADTERSRAILTATSEVGIDLPGDSEASLVSLYDLITGSLGN